MQCLYCGKGIGPIRQLRDAEFCSDAHRHKFRDRYRKQLFEALAPEPAPKSVAGFMEQAVTPVEPAPYSALQVLAKPAPEELKPVLNVDVGGMRLDPAEWTGGPHPAAMRTRPVWNDASAAFPVALHDAGLRLKVLPPSRSEAHSARTALTAKRPADRPPVAALGFSAKLKLAFPVKLPAAFKTLSPLKAEFSAPQLRPAAPMPGEAAAIGPVPSAVRATRALPSSAAIAASGTPAGTGPRAISISPATQINSPRAIEAEPLAACAELNAAIRQPVVEAVMGQAARPVKEFFLGTPSLESLARSAVRTLSADSPVKPPARSAVPHMEYAAAPVGTLAGLIEAGSSAVREAAGAIDVRSKVARATSRTAVTLDQPQMNALPGSLGTAPLLAAGDPQPAVPQAAGPSWNATPAGPAERLLAPLSNISVPPILCLPSTADAIAEPGCLLSPEKSRRIRSNAVLWIPRLIQVRVPHFKLEPFRVRFNDLLKPDRSIAYLRDAEDLPKRNNLRVFPLAPSGKQKWMFLGAAAAALLLAGILVPQMKPKSAGAGTPWQGMSVRQWINSRATRAFQDDFRGGLSQWKTVHAKMAKNWSYSSDGFIHPGALALYRPSVPLSDYRFEFMAQIENKSVDWVVRAHDANNYYALKFTVLEPGPRPLVAVVRYPVIGGAQGSRVQTPVRMMVHANTPYRVTVDVKGNRYRAYIEGQEADFWTDDRLKSGGVGFFSEAGERARVYWVKVESQGDLLGRICGLLSAKNSRDATNKEKEAMDYRHAGNTENGSFSPGGAEIAGNAAQDARISRVLSRAASLHLDGKREEAVRDLVRALDGGERHPALYFALGQLQYELEDYLPAAHSYAQAALLQPLHPTAHFNTGVCQGRLERWEEAAESFKKAIANDPARIEAHLALGACLVQLGRHNEAVDAYDRFLARYPDHEEALFGKAVALQKRDRTTEAVDIYKRILGRNPNSEEALGNLVSLSLANQDYDQARKYAQRLADAQPKSQIALEGLAAAAFAAGDHQAAANYSRKLAEIAPQVFENWFNLGVASHKAGELGNAADAYARATRVQPDSPQAHLNLGVALQEQGDLKAARAAYERALEIDSKLAGVHWNLGLVHEQLGDLPTAEKLYTQVPQNSPDSDDAAFRIGHLRLQRADYLGSVAAFRACLEKRPNWPEARLNLGIAHWRAGDKDSARTCFQELTGSGGDSKEALRGLAALSLEHQDYEQAFTIYRQLLDAGERSPELLYNAGLICQRRGQPEDAAVLYKEALKADPQFGEALLNLGHALMTLGNEFEARSCWRKAVIAKPELAQRYFEPAQAT